MSLLLYPTLSIPEFLRIVESMELVEIGHVRQSARRRGLYFVSSYIIRVGYGGSKHPGLIDLVAFQSSPGLFVITPGNWRKHVKEKENT